MKHLKPGDPERINNSISYPFRNKSDSSNDRNENIELAEEKIELHMQIHKLEDELKEKDRMIEFLQEQKHAAVRDKEEALTRYV